MQKLTSTRTRVIDCLQRDVFRVTFSHFLLNLGQ